MWLTMTIVQVQVQVRVHGTEHEGAWTNLVLRRDPKARTKFYEYCDLKRSGEEKCE